MKDILAGKGSYGFNALIGEFGDLIEQGVIDPTKVVRSAIENAGSIAGLLLTTECVIAEKPKEDKDKKKASANYGEDYD